MSETIRLWTKNTKLRGESYDKDFKKTRSYYGFHQS